MESFDQAIQLLDSRGPKELFSKFENASSLGRFGKKVEDLENDYLEYLNDFKEIKKDNIMD